MQHHLYKLSKPRVNDMSHSENEGMPLKTTDTKNILGENLKGMLSLTVMYLKYYLYLT